MNRILGALLLLGTFAAAWLWMDLQSFADRPLQMSTNAAYYTITPGKTLKGVANDLMQQGYIDSTRNLLWLARIKGKANNIKVGEYEFAQGTTVGQLLDKINKGDVKQYSFTIVEGLTFRQMLAALQQHAAIVVKLDGLSDYQIMERLGHPGEHPEGRFLPETYYFHKGMSDLDVLKRAYAAMDELLAEEWLNRAASLPYKTPYEALIMASIVEKETGVASERPEIAGVFVRRIEKRMRLETDPTVIYGIPNFDGNIKKKHLLDSSNPYNTYRIFGLPPTPIALPSREAIHAALHPNPGTTLYFVAKGGGAHYFSSTYEEHQQAVAYYQLHRPKGNLIRE